MIKSLLGDETSADKSNDEHADGKKESTESFKEVGEESEKGLDQPSLSAEADEKQKQRGVVKPFEIEEAIGKPKEKIENDFPLAKQDIQSEKSFELAIPEPNFSKANNPPTKESKEMDVETVSTKEDNQVPVSAKKKQVNVVPKSFTMESAAETSRKTGLAFSAGVSLFASVIFMMAMGWVFDSFFGTQPWGVVVGIVLGAFVGFVQFFRTTAEIMKPGKSDFEKTSISSIRDDENDKY